MLRFLQKKGIQLWLCRCVLVCNKTRTFSKALHCKTATVYPSLTFSPQFYVQWTQCPGSFQIAVAWNPNIDFGKRCILHLRSSFTLAADILACMKEGQVTSTLALLAWTVLCLVLHQAWVATTLLWPSLCKISAGSWPVCSGCTLRQFRKVLVKQKVAICSTQPVTVAEFPVHFFILHLESLLWDNFAACWALNVSWLCCYFWTCMSQDLFWCMLQEKVSELHPSSKQGLYSFSSFNAVPGGSGYQASRLPARTV